MKNLKQITATTLVATMALTLAFSKMVHADQPAESPVTYTADTALNRSMQVYVEYVKDHIRSSYNQDAYTGTGALLYNGTRDDDIGFFRFATEVHFLVTLSHEMNRAGITSRPLSNGNYIYYNDVKNDAIWAVNTLVGRLKESRDITNSWYMSKSSGPDTALPLMALSAAHEYLHRTGILTNVSDRSNLEGVLNDLVTTVTREIEDFKSYKDAQGNPIGLTDTTPLNYSTTFIGETGAAFSVPYSRLSVNYAAIAAGALGLHAYHYHRFINSDPSAYPHRSNMVQAAFYAYNSSQGSDTYGYITSVGNLYRGDNKHHVYDLGYASWVSMGLSMAAMGTTYKKDPAYGDSIFQARGFNTAKKLEGISYRAGYFPHHMLGLDADWNTYGTSNDYLINSYAYLGPNKTTAHSYPTKPLYDTHPVPDYVVVCSWNDHQGVVTAALNDGTSMRPVQGTPTPVNNFGYLTSVLNWRTAKLRLPVEGIFAMIEHDINHAAPGVDANTADPMDSIEAGYLRSLSGLTGGMYRGISF